MAQNIDYRIASPQTVALALGQRLERVRVAQNMNQTSLAENAGVSRRTITRMENGEGVTLDTLIRVMKALGIVERIETLIPDASVRPIERVRGQGRERKYAREVPTEHAAWEWGDGSEET